MTRLMHAAKQRREEALKIKQQEEAAEKKCKEKETKRKRREEEAAERKRKEKEEVENKRRGEQTDTEKKKDCISHVKKTMYVMAENKNEDDCGSSSPNQKQPPSKPVNKNPDTKIHPMEASELRAMLKLKGPPRRNPRIKDSPVFREVNGPEISSMFRAFP
jgi:hypothetical protein